MVVSTTGRLGPGIGLGQRLVRPGIAGRGMAWRGEAGQRPAWTGSLPEAGTR